MVYGRTMIKRCICPLKGIDMSKTPCDCFTQRSPSIVNEAASAPLPTDSESEYSSTIRHKRVRPYSVYAVTGVDGNDDENQPPLGPLDSEGYQTTTAPATGAQEAVDQTTPRRNPLLPKTTPTGNPLPRGNPSSAAVRLPTLIPTPQRRPLSMVVSSTSGVPRLPAPLNSSPLTNTVNPEINNGFHPSLPVPPPVITDLNDSFETEEAGSPVRRPKATIGLQEELSIDAATNAIFAPESMDQASPTNVGNCGGQNLNEPVLTNTHENSQNNSQNRALNLLSQQRRLHEQQNNEQQQLEDVVMESLHNEEQVLENQNVSENISF